MFRCQRDSASLILRSDPDGTCTTDKTEWIIANLLRLSFDGEFNRVRSGRSGLYI